MAEQTLQECTVALERIAKQFIGIPNLAESLRNNSVPILSLSHFERHGTELARVTKRVREIVREEQRKELEGHG